MKFIDIIKEDWTILIIWVGIIFLIWFMIEAIFFTPLIRWEWVIQIKN